MALPRRSVIRGAIGAGAALLTRPITLLAGEIGGAPFVTGTLDYAAFRSLRGSWFYLASMDTHEAAMARLERVSMTALDEKCEQFRLRFRPRSRQALSEGRYHVTNWDGHPEFDVYVQPVVKRRRQYLYADFALLLPESGQDS